jgi:DNA-binding XRE family transcriptional regulator
LKKEKGSELTASGKYPKSGYLRKDDNTVKRKKIKKNTESFELGTIIKEARILRQLTQEALAKKSGTTKFYISRIENDRSDIRLSTLLKIVGKGLGGNLKFSIAFTD